MSNADAAGWAWIGTPEPPEDLAGPVDAEAQDFYRERLQASSARLDTTLPADPREIGDLPLPVSMGGRRVPAEAG